MKNVVLIFPDTISLASFILASNVSNAEVNTREQTLIAPLDDDDIITACEDYGAHLNTGKALPGNFS